MVMEAASFAPLLPALRPFAASEGFEEHLRLCAQVAVGRRPAAAVGASDALVALLLEAARTGVTAEELQGALGAVLPVDRARMVAVVATEGQTTMRSALDALSLGPAELVDVRWHRATIAAAGNELPRQGGTPMYTVTLTTRAPDGSTRPLQFCANSEELTELVRCVPRQRAPPTRPPNQSALRAPQPLHARAHAGQGAQECHAAD